MQAQKHFLEAKIKIYCDMWRSVNGADLYLYCWGVEKKIHAKVFKF